MSKCMDPPGPRSARGLELSEAPLLQITGWELQAAFGCQLVVLHTDGGSQCFAITHARTAALLDELGTLLDRQLHATLTGGLGALH